MQKLIDKTALITGGNSGIGFATAKLFVEHGARVIITGRNRETLEQAQRDLGKNAIAIQSDTGNIHDIEQLMQQTREYCTELDVLFINAASGNIRPFAQMSERDFDEMVAVNFKGAFFTIQKALPYLSNNASLILTTSIAGQKGTPFFGLYSACKAAQRSLMQTLSLELRERGVRVNAVSPGPIDTPGFGRWSVPEDFVQAARDEFLRRSPMKRFGTAEEVANAVLFLASDDSSYINGAELVVDGSVSNVM